MSLPKQMKAIGFTQSFAIDEPQSLQEFHLAVPSPSSCQLLVKVQAVSVNPVDTKVRQGAAPEPLTEPKILGFDGVGEIVAMGDEVQGYALGDRIYYAGDVTLSGTNSEYHCVDYRIVAPAPKSQSDAQAAALPLTGLTAWEALFDRLHVGVTEEKTLLIIGGAGGVGSIAIQLAKQLTHLKVIATASREESKAWCEKLGADYVVNHHDLVSSVKNAGFNKVDYIFNAADTIGHWDAMVELIAPQGMICSIVESDSGVDLSMLQSKSAGFVWEFMFTRSMYKTSDLKRQHDILFQLANLLDAGRIQSTLTTTYQGLDARMLQKAHALLESGKMVGKLAITF